MFEFFSKNGQILPISEANVSLDSIEYAYGFGVYETLRVKNKKPLFLSDHVERLMLSAQIIGLDHTFSQENIEAYINELSEKIESETYNIKILLIGASAAEGANLYITCSNPMFPDKKWYRYGVYVITSNFERIYPHAKSLNMLQSYIAYKKAKKQNAYDSLLINNKGCITEGTRTNFFTIKDTTIYSPPEEEILLGVTRKNILKVAQKNSYKVEYTDIPLNSLDQYDGAFITSTSTKILPIKKVDDFEYKQIPESIKELIRLFDEFSTV